MTDQTRDAHAAYHAQQAANGIAIVAGNIARLRDLTSDPDHDATYRQMLADLGEISGTIRKMHSVASASEAA